MKHQAIRHVLSWEGGLHHDPNDPGGLTKYGITRKSYPTLDIRKLTEEQAYRIYEQDYWHGLGLGLLPGPVAFVVFDSAVNQGPYASVLILQSALGITQDGILGPNTRRAVWKREPEWVVKRFSAKRLRLYSETQNYHRYGEGWINRSLDTMLEALKLRQEDAQQRTELQGGVPEVSLQAKTKET